MAGNIFNSLHDVRKSRFAVRYCYADTAHSNIYGKKENLEMGKEKKKNQERKTLKSFMIEVGWLRQTFSPGRAGW